MEAARMTSSWSLILRQYDSSSPCSCGVLDLVVQSLLKGGLNRNSTLLECPEEANSREKPMRTDY